MEVYLVGGAVRDELLGFPVKDRDYVVVGQTPEAMLDRGFKTVGKDFPVFLHPQTGEEYALARTEKKVGPGHGGFEVVADPSIGLEEDLLRRDLTINAIARDPATGGFIDPFGGRDDLEGRLLRHVSEAFGEDPLRVLRVARFAARYANLGFEVASETMELMGRMVAQGQLQELAVERIWGEVEKALSGPSPEVFIQVLRRCGALAVIAPEIDVLYGVPQVAEHHPEICSGIHTEMVVAQAARLAPGDAQVAFAALVHDLGKGLTPKKEWPRHLNHEENGVGPVIQLCARWKVPTEYTALARVVCEKHLVAHRTLESRPGTLLRLMESVDAFRNPQRMERFILACEADSRGRLGFEDRDYSQARMMRETFQAAAAERAHRFVEEGHKGPKVGELLRRARLDAITKTRIRIRREIRDEPARGRMVFR